MDAAQDQRASASKRFGQFKPEDEKEARKPDVLESMTKRIFSAWFSVETDENSNYADFEGVYSAIMEALGGVRASQSDVSAFVDFLIKNHGKETESRSADYFAYVFSPKAGLFLSALVNTGSQEGYELDLSGLPPLSFLGFNNCKNLIIHGDISDDAGFCNKGRLEVFGNATSAFAHSMKDGEVLLHGNCEVDAGRFMDGGVIVIDGDAGEVGEQMAGGKIILKGALTCGEINLFTEAIWGNREIHLDRQQEVEIQNPDDGEGRVFIGGRLVFEDGKWIEDGESAR